MPATVVTGQEPIVCFAFQVAVNVLVSSFSAVGPRVWEMMLSISCTPSHRYLRIPFPGEEQSRPLMPSARSATNEPSWGVPSVVSEVMVTPG